MRNGQHSETDRRLYVKEECWEDVILLKQRRTCHALEHEEISYAIGETFTWNQPLEDFPL